MKEFVTGLCRITIKETEIIWENLGIEASTLTKVSGDYAVAVDENDCLYRFNILENSKKQLLCARRYYFRIIILKDNLILLSKINSRGTDTSFLEIDILTGISKNLFNIDGRLGYSLFFDRTKNQFAGCIEREQIAQPTLFLYEYANNKLYEFNDTKDVVLHPRGFG